MDQRAGERRQVQTLSISILHVIERSGQPSDVVIYITGLCSSFPFRGIGAYGPHNKRPTNWITFIFLAWLLDAASGAPMTT
jgi:hypothetical protein